MTQSLPHLQPREIKFRIWDSDASRFRYWTPLSFEELIDWDASQKRTDAGNGILDVKGWYGPEKSEQFTGLKDKDGKNIYEGDIVQCHYWLEDVFQNNIRGCNPGVVEYVPCYAAYYAVSHSTEGSLCHASLYSRPAPGNKLDARYSVLGNIHENPELLVKP